MLASIFELVGQAGINVEEMENIIFDGGHAACARIQLGGALDDEQLEAIRSNANVISASLTPLTTDLSTMSSMTTESILNFSAGPAILPRQVLEQARADILDLDGTGIGIMEHSHRGAAFTKVIDEARDNCRDTWRNPR